MIVIGTEADIGLNLKEIMNRLIANDNLVNLIYYNTSDPLGATPLTSEQKKANIFNKLITIVPKVEENEDTKSHVIVRVVNGSTDSSNESFRAITVCVDVIVPFTSWLIKDINLRPFAILGEIKKSLKGKDINGLGTLKGGDFEFSYATDTVSCYTAVYRWINYD